MRKFFVFLALFLLIASAASVLAASCCDGGPITVDGGDALKRSQRSGRDAIEGLWDVALDWHPERAAERTYRMAIVKNEYDVFKDADYLGVAACKRGDCVDGEVKMFFYRANRRSEFDAIIVTGVGYGRGVAKLASDDEGRVGALLDMSGVTFSGHIMLEAAVRVK